jgi:hypothetical protein
MSSPLLATLTYTTESSIDLDYVYGGYNWGGDRGSLAGTLTYGGTGSQPDSLEFTFDSASTLTFYDKSQGTTTTETLDAYCIVTYYNSSGTQKIIEATNSGSFTLSEIDMDYPIKFYLFYDQSTLRRTLRNANGTLASVSSGISFNPIADYDRLDATSNLGTGTMSIPLLGGGLIGPDGTNSLPATYFPYGTDTVDVPEYTIGFTETDVYIDDLSEAVDIPLEIAELELSILNYDDVYMGQTSVTVKFYQSGHTSFRFLGPGTAVIPFTLYVDGETIQPYTPCSPWDIPLAEENLVPTSISVSETDYLEATEGDYTATITVETITGI